MIPALRWLVGAAQALCEGARILRGLRQGRTVTVSTDDTEPIPLTRQQRDRMQAHVEGQIRSATEQRPEMRPPPRSSRYD